MEGEGEGRSGEQGGVAGSQWAEGLLAPPRLRLSPVDPSCSCPQRVKIQVGCNLELRLHFTMAWTFHASVQLGFNPCQIAQIQIWRELPQALRCCVSETTVPAGARKFQLCVVVDVLKVSL